VPLDHHDEESANNMTRSGKFSNYCTNCTVVAPVGEAEHLLTCWCTPLVATRGPVPSTLNLGMFLFSVMKRMCTNVH
jgi:hypothetical protein